MDKLIAYQKGNVFGPADDVSHFAILASKPKDFYYLVAYPKDGRFLPGFDCSPSSSAVIANSHRYTSDEVRDLLVVLMEKINDDTTHVIILPKRGD